MTGTDVDPSLALAQEERILQQFARAVFSWLRALGHGLGAPGELWIRSRDHCRATGSGSSKPKWECRLLSQ